MDKPRLKLADGSEFAIEGRVTSIGRTPDNDLALPDDSNISRFHAEIEDREGEFWLLDLRSSNGTKVNGERVTTDKPLFDGDRIELGGSSELEFLIRPETPQEEDETEEEPIEDADKTGDSDEDAGSADAAAGGQGKRLTLLLVFASILIGLAVVIAAAAAIFYFTGDGLASGCDATAEIRSPENGDILSETSAVEIDVSNGECVSQAVFIIGGKEFARADMEPYEASLDPSKFPEMSDGRDRKISIVLIDEDGNALPQENEIAISIETIETEVPEPTEAPQIPGGGKKDTGPKAVPAMTSLIETQQMALKVVPQFTGNLRYNTNNQRFLEEVGKMTSEYRSEGFYARASKYRDVINYQYLREQNLDPPLGYILAMSRTKFQPTNRADGAGLWKMNNQLVLDNAYNGICGPETIASETQKCAAIASSSYLKDIILNVFNGDLIYGVAAFGMDKQEAAEWNASLPTDPRIRGDFWNVIRDPRRREEVVRFFAAAIVAENPQKFGLKNEKPISTLYPAYTE